MTESNTLSLESRINTLFTWIENSIIRSKKISLEGLGLYLILRSFAGHRGATAHPSIGYLCDLASCGKDKLRAAMQELIDGGLLEKKQIKDEKGVFSRNVYILLDVAAPQNPQTPENSESYPCSGFPATGEPTTEIPPQKRIINPKNHLEEKSSSINQSAPAPPTPEK